MKKVLIHTVTNPQTDKKILELYFLKTLYLISNISFDEYEIHIRIDSWNALEETNFLSYAIDNCDNEFEGDTLNYTNQLAYLHHKSTMNNIKNDVNDIIKENPQISKSFKSIKVSTEFIDYESYTGGSHFNILGNVFKETKDFYDFYLFQSVNLFPTKRGILNEKLKILNNSTIPFLYDNKFFSFFAESNEVRAGTNTMNVFLINNTHFINYLKKLDEIENINFLSPNSDIIKISETFRFGCSDQRPNNGDENTTRIKYLKNYSDFLPHQSTLSIHIINYILNKNLLIRRNIESGPFLFEFILWTYFRENTSKKYFYNVKELEKQCPIELKSPKYVLKNFVRFPHHKQNMLYVVKALYLHLKQNTNLDLSPLVEILKEKINIDYQLTSMFKAALESNTDMKPVISLSKKYKDEVVLDDIRVKLKKIIKEYEKNYNIQWPPRII